MRCHELACCGRSVLMKRNSNTFFDPTLSDSKDCLGFEPSLSLVLALNSM